MPSLRVAVALSILLMGCRTSQVAQAPVSYGSAVRKARESLLEGKTLEAKKWAGEALQRKPENLEAQRLMAKVISREIAGEKFLAQATSPAFVPPSEALSPQERKLQAKTWLERSREFLEFNQFDEALSAAERVFQFDPENLEASRLIDEIKEKARQQGKEDELFLQGLYQEEIDKRIRRYANQAEAWIRDHKEGAARLAVEKILLLDPRNPRSRRLLTMLDEKDETRKTF